ncbi:bifunctional indole-3-glycerol-phosphate synthase TrpC/phosphoribosylanthranilate isomerase TrpF [Enterobacteriaceae endosymbiont of Macroplea mutica]|uniref:bifunctional indole-3-glycerol-phosphate synthase TrpC/phosphoribosylanthranilate isomerase TrpF n=1 Tax=Enterobacteriaceae endosymbiont of Macroplea mutica TaxID=2675791 RepID=UPI001449FD59|nr:bifunctional indole-3-glycerol-phosphate synthase TrpC/phosphoribosylanthranilate isomerase TrpF [Enterobacteriaceae endosymbiont of Macroplea mutica]QJC31134.1 bifunctional indole-3-glycerol-phosphate synthase TrpC/phosphoribosylanthranilate isomerase TrpF [Enterobacteriaceae endosymbiont of Macroplea mutica]
MFKIDILQLIIKNKISWIIEQQKHLSINVLKTKVHKTKLNFYTKTNTYLLNKIFILEYKKHSPTQKIISQNVHIIHVAKIYQQYATAISVVTDEKFFSGSFKYLKLMSQITNKPILCKDFFLDPYQIFFARYYGADIILLILTILSDTQYIILRNIAHQLNMSVITEVSNKIEFKRAINLKAKIIMINNRNLKNFTINIYNTINILNNINVNYKTILISASGIKQHTQIQKLNKFVHGYLIGTALLSNKNILLNVKKIMFGNNKICGLKKNYDAYISSQAGSIFGGLIFTKQSIRYISLVHAINIVNNTTTLLYIGVFYNNSITDIIKVIQKIPLFAIQLHGNEDQNFINNVKNKIPKHIQIWKTYNINNTIPQQKFSHIDLFVYDYYLPGSGKTFNWDLLKHINKKNILLAGGLNIYNCVQAAQLKCYGLDFNSGVEKTPGIKDIIKINNIFHKLRNCT